MKSEIGFYTEETFEDVPPVSGVYAWFYPLRITTHNLGDFVAEVNKVFLYDSLKDDVPRRKDYFQFAWSQIQVALELKATNFEYGRFAELWQKLIQDEQAFDEFRKSIMKASILMPPLYVGKTINLSIRCGQHRADGSFHQRFERFAKKHSLSVRSISDLLFVCISTKAVQNEQVEDLAEHILKNLAKPAYSIR